MFLHLSNNLDSPYTYVTLRRKIAKGTGRSVTFYRRKFRRVFYVRKALVPDGILSSYI